MNPDKQIEAIRKRYSGRVRIATQKAAREMALYIVEVVKARTRFLGEGTAGKLKPLKQSTKKNRERYKENLSQDTSPGESNLTGTGQLLDALRGRAGAGKVTVDIKPGKRKGELSGGRSTLSNQEVRKYVEEDREFLKLSEQEKKDATELATQIIKEQLRGLL